MLFVVVYVASIRKSEYFVKLLMISNLIFAYIGLFRDIILHEDTPSYDDDQIHHENSSKIVTRLVAICT